MLKDNFLAWMKEGNISIPSFLLSHYKRMGLNELELMVLLHIQHYNEKGNSFPTPDQISERMSVDSSQCSSLLRRLIQKGFLQIKEEYREDSILFEMYTLDPMYDKLLQFFLKVQNETSSVQVELETEESLYTVFEKEFGRPLSPFECETLAMWMEDEHHFTMIKAALKEAVISGKLNFRYIDRILFEWKKNGIRTPEQAKTHGQKFRLQNRREKKQDIPQANKTVPFYNWLEQ
ncbi:DnaD domain-containing protein [Peribacillus deserti]|uniref:DNA replication protein DnaD n=1 Tax=Peribacillus deserti TaxID=673318 RepID=A0A2N5M223_9BACI|nr:DnaD domain-containing protein [Peribacillus deserti]PLT28365.1 DNA replication protein DnaD [Peribacillus deserti]